MELADLKSLPVSFTCIQSVMYKIINRPFLMFILLVVSIYFVFAGGQIAVLVTDFIQGIFISVIFVVITVFFFTKHPAFPIELL